MAYDASPLIYTPQTTDPIVTAWLTAGAEASGPTQGRMTKFFTACRDADLLWDSDTSAGIRRLNLMCGNDLEDALRPQIVEGLGTTTETNVGFTEGDYREFGYQGGIVKQAGAYLNLGFSPNDFASDVGGLGCLLPYGWQDVGAWDCPMMSYVTATTSLWGLRGYNAGSGVQGCWNSGTVAYNAWSIHNGTYPDLHNVWSSGTGSVDVEVYANKTQDAGAAAGTSGSTYSTHNVFLFGSNTNGALAWEYTTGMSIGGYFIYSGAWTDTKREALVDAWVTYAEEMGRGTS